MRRPHPDKPSRLRGSDSRRARRRPPKAPAHEPAHLSDDIVRELHSTARPGKAEILVKVFGDAVGAFVAGDFREAIRLGEQAKHMALRSVSIREFLGLALYRSERWAEAVTELSAYRRISGSRSQNPVLADCYRAMGKPERALELCAELDPEADQVAVVYECAIVAAGALAEMGQVDAAIARLEALELRPAVAEQHHVRAWYVLADLLERKGRFSRAREYFEAVAAADPELTDAPERLERL